EKDADSHDPPIYKYYIIYKHDNVFIRFINKPKFNEKTIYVDADLNTSIPNFYLIPSESFPSSFGKHHCER
ncbi:8173_t:CDS:1, partial [Cetraspora pellucida]